MQGLKISFKIWNFKTFIKQSIEIRSDCRFLYGVQIVTCDICEQKQKLYEIVVVASASQDDVK